MSQSTRRRDFLIGGVVAGAGMAFANPVEKLLSALTTGWLKQARAEATGLIGTRNYINIGMLGAPSRYLFDHWMRTSHGDISIDANPMVSSRFVFENGRAARTELATFDYKGVLVPSIFSQSVYNGAGQLRPLSHLLDNMLVIRGYGTNVDGHPSNFSTQLAPIGGVSSLGGVAAEGMDRSFPAIEWPARGSYSGYNSSKGKTLNVLNGANPVAAMMQGFAAPDGSRNKGRSVKERNKEAFDLAQSRLRAYANTSHQGSAIVAKNMSNAAALMKKGVGNIDGFWNEALPRYQRVIRNSLRQSGLPGISDQALISSMDPRWRVLANSGDIFTVSSDSDFRHVLNSLDVLYIAEGLALAEYAFKEGLLSTLQITVGEVASAIFQTVERGPVNTVLSTDMHETGCMAHVLLGTAFYRGLAAGILELKDRLSGTTIAGRNLWSETVVQLSSDFERSARSDGSGSDHGFGQMVTSVFSGAIKSPLVVGNIYKGGHNAAYGGTQGIAAPIEGYNQAGRPTPAMAAATVAAVLRVEKNPYQNIAAPLVSEDSSGIKVLKMAKVVA